MTSDYYCITKLRKPHVKITNLPYDEVSSNLLISEVTYQHSAAEEACMQPPVTTVEVTLMDDFLSTSGVVFLPCLHCCLTSWIPVNFHIPLFDGDKM